MKDALINISTLSVPTDRVIAFISKLPASEQLKASMVAKANCMDSHGILSGEQTGKVLGIATSMFFNDPNNYSLHEVAKMPASRNGACLQR